MIHDQDRSGWFGASDTAKIMGRWDTKTFELFWREKLGLYQSNLKTVAMQTGTRLEGRILDAIGVKTRDRQIRISRLSLRVNLDGEDAIIHEVKTHKKPKFAVTKPYWQQAQVEMFAARKALEIVAYQVTEEEYANWFLPIDPARITRHPIPYDGGWIGAEYLPRLEYLSACLQSGIYPKEG